MEINFLQTIWFSLIIVLLIGYAILDGFDLGIAILEPFLSKSYDDTRVLYSSIGPFWDGNEVWLLTAGGALFAAFPTAYATIFSGFYIALMLVLFALIFRAVSLEFWLHDKDSNKKIWKKTFTFGSLIPSLLYGVAIGNLIQGLPLNANMDYEGGLIGLLRPFPLIAGVFGLILIINHGALYATLKTENELNLRSRKISRILSISTLFLFVVTSISYSLLSTTRDANVWVYPILCLAFVLLNAEIFLIHRKKELAAFITSSIFIATIWIAIAINNFPYIVKSTSDFSNSLHIAKIASSNLTLTVMLIIAAIGVPMVLGYTFLVYRLFKGKVRLNK